MKPLEYKAQHHPNTSSTLCRTAHINNKQNKNTYPIIGRQDYHLTQPCPSEEKQTNKQKLSTNLTPYKAYTKHWTYLEGEGEVAQSCPTLCDPMDCSLPGSSIHGIFQARVLEWDQKEEKKFKLQGKNSTFLEAWEKETSNKIS